MTRRFRLAVLNTHPQPYTAPLYCALAREPEIDLTVYYCSRLGLEPHVDPAFGTKFKWDVPLIDGYRWKFLPELRGRSALGSFGSLVNPSIVTELARGRYDAFWLHGHTYATDMLAFVSARLSRIPIFYHSESSLYFDRVVRRRAHVRIIKPLVLRFMFGGVARFLAVGSRNREFYLRYGAQPEQIFHVPYSVDNAYFADMAAKYRPSRDALRTELGIKPRDVVFLWAAKMTEQKAPLPMLEAFASLRDIEDIALLMVGDGTLHKAAEEFVRERRLDNVHFTGFANQSEMAKFYSMSDVFVRPDGVYQGDWGLTVNEAMAAGLALVSTDGIGATDDLVRHGDNGMVVSFGDTQTLTSAFRELALSPEMCGRMGARSAEIIQTWSYRECVRGTLDALRSLPGRSVRPLEIART
jgi:glycosyltransferase involved in cell wall biosynthesis